MDLPFQVRFAATLAQGSNRLLHLFFQNEHGSSNTPDHSFLLYRLLVDLVGIILEDEILELLDLAQLVIGLQVVGKRFDSSSRSRGLVGGKSRFDNGECRCVIG